MWILRRSYGFLVHYYTVARRLEVSILVVFLMWYVQVLSDVQLNAHGHHNVIIIGGFSLIPEFTNWGHVSEKTWQIQCVQHL